MKKKIFKWVLVIAIVLFCALIAFYHYYDQRKDYYIATAIAISSITDKYYDGNNYFVTVQLDTNAYRQYEIAQEYLTIRTSEAIYNKVIVDDVYVGMSLVIIIPYDQPKIELEMTLSEFLKGNLTDYSEITGITTPGNESIS